MYTRHDHVGRVRLGFDFEHVETVCTEIEHVHRGIDRFDNLLRIQFLYDILEINRVSKENRQHVMRLESNGYDGCVCLSFTLETIKGRLLRKWSWPGRLPGASVQCAAASSDRKSVV